MSEAIDSAVEALKQKLGSGEAPDGSFKFEIEGEGIVRLVDGALTTEDGEADVTITASMDTFREMFDGELSPTTAYMAGRIAIDGDMGAAMKLSQLIG